MLRNAHGQHLRWVHRSTALSGSGYAADVYFVVAEAVLVAICVTALVRAVVNEVRIRRARRHGLHVVGDVVELRTTRRYHGGYNVTPVVRYGIDGRQYTCAISNRSDATDVGSRMEVAVDPFNPYQAWAVYGEDSVLLRGSVFATIVSGLLLTYSIAHLR
jgi:hypothetical protein